MAQSTASWGVLEGMQKYWWLVLLRGIVATLFGLITIVHPDITFAFLALYLGLFLMINGVIDIVSGIMRAGSDLTWVLQIVFGIVLVGVGVYLLQRPALSLATFVALVAIAFMVRGFFDLIEVFMSQMDTSQKVLSAIVGILAIVAGIAIWRYPVSGGLAFVWLIGLYALISGPIWIAASLKLKNLTTDD